MIFADIPPHTRVFIDANTFIYHFAPHPLLQAPCQQFLERVCQNDVSGFTSTHVLSNVAHRRMTLEAMAAFGWPAAGIVYRLQRQSAQIRRLTAFRQSIEEVPALGIQVLPVAGDHVLAAVEISQRNGLLCGDALVVAMMRAHGLTHLASHDADFDCEAGLTRYAPA